MNSILQVFLRLPSGPLLQYYVIHEKGLTIPLKELQISLAAMFQTQHRDILDEKMHTIIRQKCGFRTGQQHDINEFITKLVLMKPFSTATQFISANTTFDPKIPVTQKDVEDNFSFKKMKESLNTYRVDIGPNPDPERKNGINYEYANSLDVSVTDNNTIPLLSLKMCLDNYFKAEIPETKLTNKDDFMKQNRMLLCPKVFVICLKRYFDTGKRIIPLKHFIDIPQQFSYDNCNYTMHAFVDHKGTSIHSGHYISTVYDKSSNQWIQYNDRKVTRLPKGLDYQKTFNTFDEKKEDNRYVLVYLRE